MTEMWMPGAVQLPQPGGVTMNPALPSRVTWHITWDALNNGQQPAFDGVSGYLQNQGYCPHLMWDPWTGRIVQFYPANQGGRALVNWNQDGQYNIQIETFFSPGTVRDGVTYNTVADTPCVGLDRILAWTDSLGIPRVWPMGSPQWQGNSRDTGIWNSQPGHYGHCNVPDNTHTDPGPMPSLTGGITAQSITTQEEDPLATLSDEDKNNLFNALARIDAFCTNPPAEFVEAVAKRVHTRPLAYNVNGKDTGAPTTLAAMVSNNDSNINTTRQYVRDVVAAALAQLLAKVDTPVVDLTGIEAAVREAIAKAPAPVAVVDVPAIAKAVNDDAATRRADWK